MVRIVYLIPALILAAFASPAARPQDPGTPIVIGTSYVLPTRHLDAPRIVNVRLPAGYDDPANSGKRYRTLYLLDGGVDQDFHHISGLAQHAEISGTFEPFILVGMASVKRSYELTFANSDDRLGDFLKPDGGSQRMRDFIRQDVKPFIEGRFRTSGDDVLMGESLAGLFVTETLLREPGLFDAYVAISPSLWWSREALPAEAPKLLEAHDSSPRAFYLTVANEGGTLRRGVDTMVKALESHAPATLGWRFVDRQDNEIHASIFHMAALDALRLLYALPYREGSPARYPWVFTSEPPPYGADAEADLKRDCTRETARRVTLAQVNADPFYWRGICVMIDYGPPSPEKGTARWP